MISACCIGGGKVRGMAGVWKTAGVIYVLMIFGGVWPADGDAAAGLRESAAVLERGGHVMVFKQNCCGKLVR